MEQKTISPIVLTILDGWGYSQNSHGNAIKLAKTSTMDTLWNNYPHTVLNASGEDVGLPNGQMGNSEVGHTTIGAGRIINQDLARISKSINNKSFFTNPVLHNICEEIAAKKKKLHLIGLCSNGGVHSHINHLKALVKLIKEYNTIICLHLITDGRDTKPIEAVKFIQEIMDEIQIIPNIKICTISGRYYSMDRDCRWSRTEKAYKTLVNNDINSYENAIVTLNKYYKQGISDEFIPPTRLCKGKISSNDGIIFFNFRPDRIRQLLHCFAKITFKGFKTKKIDKLKYVTFTKYDSSLNIPIVFPPEQKSNFLGQIISNQGLKQLRLAETEKYAHVTYFFNGGTEEPFPGEDRELIPSPKVDTYDLCPEMSAYQLTQSVIQAINKNIYKLIIVNYANPDMVGHTGNLESTIEAINIVDKCIEDLLNQVQLVNGTLIITADHGNAEYMLTKDNKPCKSHSTNLVPFILIENQISNPYSLQEQGSLADIAPTILDILKINIPSDMNGKSLIIKETSKTLL
uniref:2,3-bisphosphoglycerate-independent phosphoglycerate mutase n=1 Tax=Schimmelmannia schousboei TaxID=173468 RepID=A0A1C9C8S0_9FLOR|nr:phosphoglycerate mutase [Schimmelmannia schousboei]AOM64769.1 phosphoglycerate mutase [Schimmelmannia schousboei]